MDELIEGKTAESRGRVKKLIEGRSCIEQI